MQARLIKREKGLMKYRKFGKLEWEVSVLGFGTMRLPLTGSDAVDVDEPESIRMLRYAIDHGVNYLDTAHGYHRGQSEGIVGRALQDGYRERVKLATKLLARRVESASDFDRIFNEQLERLQTGKIDFYLLHALDGDCWPKVRDMGILRWAEDKMAQGKFDYLGFSFHDNYEVFKEIVDAYDNWTLAQIQYNYMDADFKAGRRGPDRRGLEYAAGKGLALVIMEPLRGGNLAKEPPSSVAKVLEMAPRKRTPAEWGLLWVWNQPEVSVVLSGMSTMEQVVENIATAGRSGPGTLAPDELSLIERVREIYDKLSPIPCTGCNYCMPCPNGVEIPSIFRIYNEMNIYEAPRMGWSLYMGDGGLREEQRADQCIACGECMEACPQKIPIPEWLSKAHARLSSEE